LGIGSDDGEIYAWSEGTRGHLAGGTLPLKRRGGKTTCFPVGDTFVSSETLLKKVPPFISNWAVEFAIVCAVFGLRMVSSASSNYDRGKGTNGGFWPVACAV
jgi:hypothetical protein